MDQHKMSKAALKAMIKEHRKPLGKMSKADMVMECMKYRSPEDVMAPAIKETSMNAKIAEEVHAVGSEKPKQAKATKAPVHHKKEDDTVPGQTALRMYQEHGHAEKAEHHGTKKGMARKTARKAFEPEAPKEEHAMSKGGKKMTAYQAFVSKHRKMGHSMAEVAAMYKKEKGEKH